MSEIKLFFDKSIEKNASIHFDESKKFSKKIIGGEKALILLKEKEKKKSILAEKKNSKTIVKKREKKWFESFRWCFTSNGFLIIGGHSAQQNEQIVKKRMEFEDKYFHADVFGAPHCIMKTNGEVVPKKDLLEGAKFAVLFSKAWQENRAFADVYSVKPEQVSKKAPSGESISTGAFMIYGKRDWFKKTPLECAFGITKEGGPVCGPIDCVKVNSKKHVVLYQGKTKKSDVAKKLVDLFKSDMNLQLDEVIRLLPNGNFSFQN